MRGIKEIIPDVLPSDLSASERDRLLNLLCQRRWYSRNKAKKCLSTKLYKKTHFISRAGVPRNAVKNALYEKKWASKNAFKLCVKEQVRKARKLNNSTRLITAQEQEEIFSRAKAFGVCPICNEVPTKWHLEHAIPLCRGGGHTKENLYYCCAHCNLTKNKKTLYEFWGKGIESIPYLINTF